MENSTRKIARQVCRQLQHEIDTWAGLRVHVDCNIPGNIDFVRRTKLTWATVTNLGDLITTTTDTENNNPEELLQFPEALKGLVTQASVSAPLINSILKLCMSTLTHLNFCGTSLISCPIEKELQVGRLEFPNLQTLAIDYDVTYAEEAQIETLKQNLMLIFESFRCPVIKTLNVEPRIFPETILSWDKDKRPALRGEWEAQLKKFIHDHRSSLQNLCIYFHDDSEEACKNSFECPNHVQHYTLRCSLSHPGSAPSKNFYWKKILLSQRSTLRSFVIRAELWHDLGGTFSMLKRLISQNHETLEDVCIGSLWRQSNDICSTFDFRVDFSVFKPCQALTSLDLYANNNSTVMVAPLVQPLGQNLSHLPYSLSILKISGVRLRCDELLALEFYPKLQKVSLSDVGTSGVFGVNFRVLAAILRNKSVKKCMFSGFNMETDRQQLEKFVRDRNGGRFSNHIIVCKREYYNAPRKPLTASKECKSPSENKQDHGHRGCFAW